MTENIWHHGMFKMMITKMCSSERKIYAESKKGISLNK